MKTLTEVELAAIDGGEFQPLSGPFSLYIPPAPRAPMNGFVGSLSVTPSSLNG